MDTPNNTKVDDEDKNAKFSDIPRHIYEDTITEIKTQYENPLNILYNIIGLISIFIILSTFALQFYYIYAYGLKRKFPDIYSNTRIVGFIMLLFYAYMHLQYHMHIIFDVVVVHLLLHMILGFVILQVLIVLFY